MLNTHVGGGGVRVCAGDGGVGGVYKKATRSVHSHNHSQLSIGILRTLCPQHGVVTAVNECLAVWAGGEWVMCERGHLTSANWNSETKTKHKNK